MRNYACSLVAKAAGIVCTDFHRNRLIAVEDVKYCNVGHILRHNVVPVVSQESQEGTDSGGDVRAWDVDDYPAATPSSSPWHRHRQ